jgi:hypothetical protein
MSSIALRPGKLSDSFGEADAIEMLDEFDRAATGLLTAPDARSGVDRKTGFAGGASADKFMRRAVSKLHAAPLRYRDQVGVAGAFDLLSANAQDFPPCRERETPPE